MSTLLFIPLSGHASGIFDKLFLKVNDDHIAHKKDRSIKPPPTILAVETQWDNGGHTGIMNNFFEHLFQTDEFKQERWEGFQPPPAMGDLKPQISRWSKKLLPEEFNNTIRGLIGNRHSDLNLVFAQLNILIKTLQNVAPHIFSDEQNMNFLSTYTNAFREFASKGSPETKHSVGNLFLGFLYFYSYLVRDKEDLLYDHHHQVFFNFLKDLFLTPRGVRLEFLIDGRFKLTGMSKDNVFIPTEKQFDDYEAEQPVDPKSYNIESIIPGDIEDQFEDMFNRTDLVVLPPGSLSNWMPLVNKFSDLLKTKPVIWIINSFHHVSEVSLREQIEFVKSLGINPIILAPSVDGPFEVLSDFDKKTFIDQYETERKTPINFSETFEGIEDTLILRCIPLERHEIRDGGIKYDPSFINEFLRKLADSLDDYDEISNELVQELSSDLVSELSKEFKII